MEAQAIRDLVFGRQRWVWMTVLGDVKMISIHTDKWLRGKEGFCVDQNNNHPLEVTAKVCDFFSVDSKSWNENKVRSTFNEDDSTVILTTRIPQNSTKDRIAWVHSNDGQYMVKSGYQQWHLSHIGEAWVQQSNGWSRIWHLSIPCKIKIFIWRFCRNNILIRNLVRGKGVQVPVGCAIGEVEHLLHLFFDCRFADKCWRRVGLLYDMWEVENGSD